MGFVKRETGALLEKASRAIRGGKILLARGDADFAAGRAYYAMFYTASALLIERGAVHRAFGEEFIKTGAVAPTFYRRLLDAHDMRIAGDYGSETRLPVADVRKTLQQAQSFLLEARRCLDLRRFGMQENTRTHRTRY